MSRIRDARYEKTWPFRLIPGVGEGGGKGTPIYGLYGDVPLNRVWFLSVWDRVCKSLFLVWNRVGTGSIFSASITHDQISCCKMCSTQHEIIYANRRARVRHMPRLRNHC